MRLSPTDLERLYDAHAQSLFACLLQATRNEDDTREILQEVFVRLARGGASWRGSREERAYLLRMARNLAIDRFRHLSREELSDQPPELFARSDDPDLARFRAALGLALGELPEEQRTVAHLKLWEEFTFEEIARATGVSPNTAASRYRYALDKLRLLLRPFYDEIR